MCKGGKSKHLKIENQAKMWNILRVWRSAMHKMLFCFDCVYFKGKIIDLDFFLGK